MDKKDDYTKQEQKVLNSLCEPGETKCLGDTIHKCRTDGSGWFDTGRKCKDGTILFEEDDFENENENLEFDEEKDFDNSSATEKSICGHLEVISSYPRAVTVLATQTGRRFRWVWSRNRRVTSISGTIVTISGKQYRATSGTQITIGINCISKKSTFYFGGHHFNANEDASVKYLIDENDESGNPCSGNACNYVEHRFDRASRAYVFHNLSEKQILVRVRKADYFGCLGAYRTGIIQPYSKWNSGFFGFCNYSASFR